MRHKVRGTLVSVKFVFAFLIVSFFGFHTAQATEYPVLGYLEATNLQCPPGTWVRTWLQSGHNVYQCTECAKGTWKAGVQTRDDATSEQTCALAGKPYYVDTVGASEQTPCPTGSVTLSRGQTSVTKCLCLKGYYSAAGYAPCTIASAGNFVNGIGQKAQTPASPGRYVPTAGATAQLKCPAGTYAAGEGNQSCTSCSPGTSTVTGSTSQESCLYSSPADYYTAWGGKAAPGTKGGNPQKCKSGKNWKTSQQACK